MALGAWSCAERRQHFWGKDASIPTTTEPVWIPRSFIVTVDLRLEMATASAYFSGFGGWC